MVGETIHNDLSHSARVAPDPLDLVDTVGGDWHRDREDADAGAAELQLSPVCRLRLSAPRVLVADRRMALQGAPTQPDAPSRYSQDNTRNIRIKYAPTPENIHHNTFKMGPVFYYSVSVWCRCRARVSAFRSREFLQSCNRDHQGQDRPGLGWPWTPAWFPNPRAGSLPAFWLVATRHHWPLIGRWWAPWPVHWADLDLKLGPGCLGRAGATWSCTQPDVILE